MSLRGRRALRYWEGSSWDRSRGRLGDLPFDVRLRMIRRARRRLNLLRATDNVLWLGVFAALGIVIATELFVALAKA
jgi:hypothetical protein